MYHIKKGEIYMKKGHLIIVSGPSGVGKGTVINELMKQEELNLRYSVSCTTRQPRQGEIDGVHYYFVSHEKFDEMIAQNAFLEYAKFVENSYGTPKAKVEEQLEAGLNVLLEIEMTGAIQVIEQCPEAISIFILPPSIEELEKRLRGRQTETEEVIVKRLAQAHDDLAMKNHYQYHVVNDTVENTVNEIKEIILNH